MPARRCWASFQKDCLAAFTRPSHAAIFCGLRCAAFADADSIAPWAIQSVEALAAQRVMVGTETGAFAPMEHYTTEQCLVSFLRLAENMPVSRQNGNVKKLFTYEQGLSYLAHASTFLQFTQRLKLDAQAVSFVRMEVGGVIRATSRCYFVYRDGGVLALDLGLCDAPYGLTKALVPEAPQFSADGQTFAATARLAADVYDANTEQHLHAKGTYHITADTQTGQCSAELR